MERAVTLNIKWHLRILLTFQWLVSCIWGTKIKNKILKKNDLIREQEKMTEQKKTNSNFKELKHFLL